MLCPGGRGRSHGPLGQRVRPPLFLGLAGLNWDSIWLEEGLPGMTLTLVAAVAQCVAALGPVRGYGYLWGYLGEASRQA